VGLADAQDFILQFKFLTVVQNFGGKSIIKSWSWCYKHIAVFVIL